MCVGFFFPQVDIGHGLQPPGYYVQRSGGLFPAPFPQDSPELDAVETMYQFLGEANSSRAFETI